MDKVIKTLRETRHTHGGIATAPDTDPMQVAARKWACHSLNTYTGPLLGKALKISRALAEFVEEFHKK